MSLHLEIVTPESRVFSDEVESVIFPGIDGQIGALTGHASLVCAIQPGELRCIKDGKPLELAVGTGFAEVSQTSVSVLTDLAVTDEEIDEAHVEEALKRAEESLKNADKGHDAEELATLQASIAKATAQLKLKRKYRH